MTRLSRLMFANSLACEMFIHMTKSKGNVLRLRKRQQESRLRVPAVSHRKSQPLVFSPAKNYEMAYSNDTTHFNSRDTRFEFQPGFRILLLTFRNFIAHQ